jgi:small-conductance mechanosensitive channel
LLDVQSVRDWWRYEMTSTLGKAQLERLAWTLAVVLIPAGFLAWLAHRGLKKRVAMLARNGEADSEAAHATDAVDDTDDQNPLHAAREEAQATKPRLAPDAERAARNVTRAGRHLSLLQRLPFAVLRTTLKAIPLMIFIIVALGTMTLLTEEGSTNERVIVLLIEIFVICRAITLIADMFLAPAAPRLRLLPLTGSRAAFGMRWVVRLAVVLGVGAAIGAVPVPLGLTPEAHRGIVKAVTLLGHVMVAIVIFQLRHPVANWIRTASGNSPTFSFLAHWLADAWAAVAMFFVMALWFVWALDIQNGYRVLVHDGGVSVLILIGARLVAIVTSGVLARMFKAAEREVGSITVQRAQRYYPLVRGLVSLAIFFLAANLLLAVWGFDALQAFTATSVGRRFVSACVTIAVAAAIALFVWEAINVSIDHRLDKWTETGDLMRAARLRTLLPMLRTTLFITIALVVGLTGLSELGVNIAPLLAGASIFGVALGFGSQKLVQDFITGMFLLMENAMQVGDWVTLAGVSGTVEHLSIRTVRLRGSDGSLFTVPFSSVSTVNNTNRGLGTAAVKVSIAFGQDIDLASQTLKEIGEELFEDPTYKDGIVSKFNLYGVDQIDGAMITLAGDIKCRDSSRWSVQREFNRRIVDKFRARGIEIANPLRTMLMSTEKDERKPNEPAGKDQGQGAAPGVPSPE